MRKIITMFVTIAIALLVCPLSLQVLAQQDMNPNSDFDGNGRVGVSDFLLFANHFGFSRGDAGYDAKYDLDGNGRVGVSDFLIFTNDFGKEVPPSGGPDLVVESFSVSNNNLTAGQLFTLSATVRNQGTAASEATILRYYRSPDATFSSDDTAVETDSVNGLSASGESEKSISLSAPSSAGTYYYGACVDEVSDESDTGNNCSTGVRVTVSGDETPPASTSFDLDNDGGAPHGITYANNHLYVVDHFSTEEVCAYSSNGYRVPSADFGLDITPIGITYANNHFYIIDSNDNKVYVYSISGQRVPSADFNLDSRNTDPTGITYANNRFYVVDIREDKVYAYSISGQWIPSADFNLDSDNTGPTGIAYANNQFYVVDNYDAKVYVNSGEFGGIPDLVVVSPSVSNNNLAAGQSFTLSATVRNQGTAASASATLYYYRSPDATISSDDTEVGADSVGDLSVSDTSDESISLSAPLSADTYYYGACVDNVRRENDTDNNCSTSVRVTVSSVSDGGDGPPPTSTPFSLDSNNTDPESIAYANNRFYVVDSSDDKVFDYTSSGQRDSPNDFDLDSDNGAPKGMAYANNRFYVVDSSDDKVYAYSSFRQRVPSADFDLDSDNGAPKGMTYANNRFYVVDSSDDKVYVYRSSGQRVPSADFDLSRYNGAPEGMTYADNRFYVVDSSDDKVYVYRSSGEHISSADFDLDSDNGAPVGITYADNRFYVVDEDDNKVYVYTGSEQPDTGGRSPDLVVESPSVSENNLVTGQSFTLSATVRNQGAAASTTTTLRYYLSSNETITTGDTQVGTNSVSDLSASGESKKSISLSAPSNSGTYYYGACVDNVSDESDAGNNCSTGVSVTVSSGGTPPTSTPFDLDSSNDVPYGIAYANNQFYVVDWDDDKMYVYSSTGQRISSADFALDSDNTAPIGITYADNRFYVVDRSDTKVYVYSSTGQRISSADFALNSSNREPRGIAYVDNRFYVVDRSDTKVYVYSSSGQWVSSADFDLDISPDGITYANNQFYIIESSDGKVYVYSSFGQRVPSADFYLDSDNGAPVGITYADSRFYVIDSTDDKVYVYTLSTQ